MSLMPARRQVEAISAVRDVRPGFSLRDIQHRNGYEPPERLAIRPAAAKPKRPKPQPAPRREGSRRRPTTEELQQRARRRALRERFGFDPDTARRLAAAGYGQAVLR